MATLTRAEKAWLQTLQTVLSECPSPRLGFYTSGDPTVTVYDRTKDPEIDAIMTNLNRDFGPTVEEVDAALFHLIFPSHVHSTAA